MGSLRQEVVVYGTLDQDGGKEGPERNEENMREEVPLEDLRTAMERAPL